MEDIAAEAAAQAAADAFATERESDLPRGQALHSLSRALEEYQEQESLRIAITASATGEQSSREEEDSTLSTKVKQSPILALDEEEDGQEDEDEDGESSTITDAEVEKSRELIEQLELEPITRQARGVEKLVDHLFMNILHYLDEETLQRITRVNRFWKRVIYSEPLWKTVCDTIFVPPAYRRVRVLSNGKPRKYKTWLGTAMKRSRVRTSGMYVLRQFYIRNPGPKTMWSVSHEPFHQVKHYRYLWFLPHGRVLYTINPKPPEKVERDMIAWILSHKYDGSLEPSVACSATVSGDDLFHPAALQDAALISRFGTVHSSAQDVYLGSYQVRDGVVTVVVSLNRHTSKFKLDIGSSSHHAVHDRLTMTVLQSVYHDNTASIQTYDLEESDEDWSFRYKPAKQAFIR